MKGDYSYPVNVVIEALLPSSKASFLEANPNCPELPPPPKPARPGLTKEEKEQQRLKLLGGKASDGDVQEAPAAKRKLTPKPDRETSSRKILHNREVSDRQPSEVKVVPYDSSVHHLIEGLEVRSVRCRARR